MIFTEPNKENLKKYGRNFPYKAWLPNMVEDITPNEDSAVTYRCYGIYKNISSNNSKFKEIFFSGRIYK